MTIIRIITLNSCCKSHTARMINIPLMANNPEICHIYDIYIFHDTVPHQTI